MATSPESIAGARPAGNLDAALANTWGRLLIPSLSDLLFVAALLWLFVAGQGWTSLLADGDTGWHIRTGEYILDHGEVPRQDLFSFSKPHATWYAWEWLSDVAFAVAFHAAGLKGVVLLAGVVIAAFGTLLLRFLIWRGANMFAAMAVGLLSVGASTLHFLARPHVFTLLLLVVGLWVVESDRRAPSARVWLLVPLTALWTNLHGGFMVFIVLMGVLAAGSGVEAFLFRPAGDGRWSGVWRYAGLTGACLAASVCNPYGLRLHEHIVEYLRSDWIRSVVQEFQSPNFRNENVLQFEALLFAGLVTAGFLVRRRRITEALWIVVCGHLALASARHVPIYAVASAPWIACELTRWWQALAAPAAKGSLMRILDQMSGDLTAAFRRTSVWPALAVLAVMSIDKPIAWPTDFPSLTFPTAMVARHKEELAQSRVFTEDQWGDYLIYSNYPRQQVFFDGRSDFYGEALGTECLHLSQGNWDWERLLAKHGFTEVLAPVSWPLAQLLKKNSGWRIVDDDGQAILFARRRQ